MLPRGFSKPAGICGGVRADVAIKVHGDDLEQLVALGSQIEEIIGAIPGAAPASPGG